MTVDTDLPQPEQFEFQAEVTRLLHLMVHSVYSDKDVFLRELISNASDACDKLRYEAIAAPGLLEGAGDLHILITADRKGRRLTVADNGIGMDRQDLIDNLGTIARSGTARFVEALEGKGADQARLIGQFGVGFYSAFMVADDVRVTSRKAGTDESWVWTSDGSGRFTVEAAAEVPDLFAACGTAVTLHLRKGDAGYLEPDRLRRVIETYSNHISFPILLAGEGDAEPEKLNRAGALWARPKSEISDEDYTEFFAHVAHGQGSPWKTIHYKAEGRSEYTVLLFIPDQRPFNLFDPERACAVRLYVNRVFITADAPLLPPYLRFVRGVVDSADMPLTISREMLQNNPRVAAIRKGVTGRILSELKKTAQKDEEAYGKFWTAFGPVLKEGLYEDGGRHDDILALARFRTTRPETGWRSLAQYVADMKENQTAIYYLLAEEGVTASPQLEGFKARGIEVLLLSDPVDSFWVAVSQGYEGKPFQSVTRGAAELDQFAREDEALQSGEEEDAPGEAAIATLIALVKQTLGDKVSDVRKSARLTGSAVCLVADDHGLDMRMERILASHDMMPQGAPARVLELNPGHALIKALARRAAEAKPGAAAALEDAAHLLYDQARILEGEPVADPAAFARRLGEVMTKAV